MAIKVLNSTGVTIYLVAVPSTEWVNCGEAITALKNGSQIDCPQSFGDIAESRGVTGYTCISSDESTNSLGAVSRASLEIGMLLNPDDLKGQRKLRRAFLDNTPLVMGVDLGDVMIYFNIVVSSVSTGIAMDSAISYNVVAEISSNVMECSTKNLVTQPIVNNGIIIINNGVPVVNTH